MRVTRKMMNSNSVYNINNNKSRLDQLNTQMATQKKYTDPSDDPITAVRSLRFRSSLSEVSQYLDRNASDAVSWTESTASAIDTAKELMRDLKAEYTSAANGTNEIKDKKIYYENMVHLVNEYFDVGNTASEDRYLFTGYRTNHTLTFTAEDFEKRADAVKDGSFKYTGIDEHFEASDIESYTYTARIDKAGKSGSSGVTDDEIESLDPETAKAYETYVENVTAFRMRLSYEEIDKISNGEIIVTDRSSYSFGNTTVSVEGELNFETGSGNTAAYEDYVNGDLIMTPDADVIKLYAHSDDSKGMWKKLMDAVTKAKAAGKDSITVGEIEEVKFKILDPGESLPTDPEDDTLYLLPSIDIGTNEQPVGVLGKGNAATKVNNSIGSDLVVSVPAEKEDLGAVEGDKKAIFNDITYIENDYEVNSSMLKGNKVYLNVTTGTFIFGENVQKELQKEFSQGYDISFAYNKSNWNVGDAKPEYYFNCIDKGLGDTEDDWLVYTEHEQSMNYHVGDSQSIKVNTNACDVFLLDARRDLEDLYDYLTAMDNAQSKVDKINKMKADTENYQNKEEELDYLLAAAQKELNYASEKVDYYFSRGMTKAGEYFDKVNLAATNIGTSSKRLELIKNRLIADKTTVNTQTSNNENVDLSTLAVDVNEASLLYSAALQVTGKIGQQSLVNYI